METDQYTVMLVEHADDGPIEIRCARDLGLAIKANTDKGLVNITAHIIDKNDPLATQLPLALLAPANSVGANGPEAPISASTGGTTTGKRKARGRPPSSGSKGKRAKGSVRDIILRSLAELRALRIAEPPRIQVALFAGYSNASSAGFAKALSGLKQDGLVAYQSSKTVGLTETGLNADVMKGVVPPKNNCEVHERIKQLLKPKMKEMFDALADGGVHNREDVAQRMGYTNQMSSGFAKAVSMMKSLGLLDYPKNEVDPKVKMVKLTDIAFPFQIQTGCGLQHEGAVSPSTV